MFAKVRNFHSSLFNLSFRILIEIFYLNIQTNNLTSNYIWIIHVNLLEGTNDTYMA